VPGLDGSRAACYGEVVAEVTAKANPVPTRQRRAGRPPADVPDDLVHTCVGVLLANPKGLTTYEIVDLLGEQPSLPARSRAGRFKQVERALRSVAARKRGVAAVTPDEARPRRTGKQPSKLWRIQAAEQRAA